MKFHCDRCKTRYSIADDRVRGKILKIRCKNCSSVITVREQDGGDGGVIRATTSSGDSGANAAPPIPAAAKKASPSGPTPKRVPAAPTSEIPVGASAEISVEKVRAATSSPPPAPGSAGDDAPETLEPEWYVSVDGDQSGPFSLEEAKEWVRQRPAEDEIHCWSEGFDDWLSVDKVSHFRGTRQPSFDGQGDWGEDENTVIETGDSLAASGAGASASFGTPIRAGEPLPPSLAAQQREKTAPPVAPPSGKKPLLEPINDDDAPSLEFDIGEASRVVSLPLLLASRGNVPGNGDPSHKRATTPGLTPPPEADLPPQAATPGALGRGSGANPVLGAGPHQPAGHAPAATGYSTGANPVLGETPTLQPETQRRRRGGWLPLALGGGVLALLAGVFIFISSGGDGEGSSVTRGSVGGGGNLGYSFTNPEGKGRRTPAQVDDLTDDTKPNQNGKVHTNGKGHKRPNHTGGTKVNNGTSGTNGNTKVEDPFDEVQIGGGTDTGPTGPLDGDDLMQVYRKNQIAIKMCLERALKRDPLLKVPKTWVSISVKPDGSVSKVDIPTLKGTELGKCLTSRISRWRFRKSTEVFSSRFPVVFDS